MEGLKIPKKWGLLRCGGKNRDKNSTCSQLLIVKAGQKSKRCPRCGTRRQISNKSREVLAWSDHQKKIRKAMLEMKGSRFRKVGDLDK